ncbi:MAG: ion channel [Candidatus Binataceae bacterium]
MAEHHSEISLAVPLMVGLCLVGLTFVVHAVAARYLIKFVHWRRSRGHRRWDVLHDLRLIFVTALAAFSAHLLDICFWAALLMGIDRAPGFPMAFYCSAGAYTTIGSGTIAIPPQWRLLGPIEAADGMLLFGLTTALLFAVIQQIQTRHGVTHTASAA